MKIHFSINQEKPEEQRTHTNNQVKSTLRENYELDINKSYI